MLAGIPITPENANRIRSIAPKLEILDEPVPTARDRLELRDPDHAPAPITGVSARARMRLNLELFQLYMNAQLRWTLPTTGFSSCSTRASPTTFAPKCGSSSSNSLTSSTSR